MSKFMKRKLFTGLAIAVSLAPSLYSISPIVAEASSRTDSEVLSVNSEDNYSNTYEQLVSLVDNNIETVDNKIVVTNKDLILNFISNNVINLQIEKDEYRTAQEIYSDIFDSINSINTVAQSDRFTLQNDGSIIETPALNLSSEKFTVMALSDGRGGGGSTNIGKGNQASTHWWGYRITTYNVNGTRDLKTAFLNSFTAQGALAIAFGLSPAGVLATIPAIGAARHGMIANSLQNVIDKGQAGRGVKLNMHRGLPTYTVTPN